MKHMKIVWLTFSLMAGAAWGQAMPAGTSVVPTNGVASATGVEGTVFITKVDGKQTLLTRGANLQQGETVNTTRNSSVRLKFRDGGETVMRPESALIVQQFNFVKDAPEQDSMVLRLIKGGLRALTGAVGKRGNVDAYKLQVSTATIGIRGTDFSARLCQKDCVEPVQSTHSNSTTQVAARAAQLLGSVKISRGSEPLALTLSTPIYAGDTIETGPHSYAVLIFRDNARVTVNASSKFVLARFGFDKKAQAEPPSMFIELIKGGLRFATGLIGKANPQLVKVRTLTATIGIRGTVFDLVCGPSASSDKAIDSELSSMPCEESLFAQTREGAIALSGDQGGELVISAGQSGRVDGANASARRLDATPDYFSGQTTPEPEKAEANLDQLFGTTSSPEITEGVFVSVHEGRIVLALASSDLIVDAGESAFAGQSLVPVKLFSAPSVLDADPFLSSGKFNPSMCRR